MSQFSSETPYYLYFFQEVIMNQTVETVLKILDFSNPAQWSVRKNRYEDNYIYEILDGSQDKLHIGTFFNGNNALVAASAPDTLNRFAYMFEEFKSLQEQIFNQTNNSVMANAPDDIKKIWAETFKLFKTYITIFNQCFEVSVESVLTSRAAWRDPYDKQED